MMMMLQMLYRPVMILKSKRHKIFIHSKYYAIYATEYGHNSLHSAIIAYSVSIISSFLIAYGWVYREDLKSKFSNKCQTKKEQER